MYSRLPSKHLTIHCTLTVYIVLYYLASYGKKSCIALYILCYDLIMYYKIKCSMLPHFLIYSSYQLSYLKLTSTRNVTMDHCEKKKLNLFVHFRLLFCISMYIVRVLFIRSLNIEILNNSINNNLNNFDCFHLIVIAWKTCFIFV